MRKIYALGGMINHPPECMGRYDSSMNTPSPHAQTVERIMRQNRDLAVRNLATAPLAVCLAMNTISQLEELRRDPHRESMIRFMPIGGDMSHTYDYFDHPDSTPTDKFYLTNLIKLAQYL